MLHLHTLTAPCLQILKGSSEEVSAAFRVLQVLEHSFHRVNGRGYTQVRRHLSIGEEGEDGGRLAGCGCVGQQHLVEIIILLCHPEKRKRGAVQRNQHAWRKRGRGDAGEKGDRQGKEGLKASGVQGRSFTI